MPYVNTILCQTPGVIVASTPSALLDPMTGQNAVLPEGAVLYGITIYRDGDSAVTAGCTMQFGVDGDPARYISVSDSISTNDLNAGHMVHKCTIVERGLTAASEMRLTLNNTLATGALIFEVEYAIYA